MGLERTQLLLALLVLLTCLRPGMAPELVPYIPKITAQDLGGRVTASTFSLEQPRCVFKQAGTTDTILLVVAYSNVSVDLQTPKTVMHGLAAPQLQTHSYYLTMPMAPEHLRCEAPQGGGRRIQVLRVGNDSHCLEDPQLSSRCNAPLPSPGPYRVKFLLVDALDTLRAQTMWSDPITLTRGQTPGSIDIWPGCRSRGMIVITAVLSILAGLLLLAFLAAFTMRFSSLWRPEEAPEQLRIGSYKGKRYITYHIPPNEASMLGDPLPKLRPYSPASGRLQGPSSALEPRITQEELRNPTPSSVSSSQINHTRALVHCNC
ncbi:LOW QUALITY PROTEIN: uroplakin-3b-like [Suncus etruscus]|uniref:LOW QUALITY PROTEIN: uroplakin-3b-like n=1 Tax=Suncus etruscus TaxID=109475 RepID=UPI0021100E9D|nr:LOW QUALITY PROTEIN: uroplakin-3b-like [Suncus etruscus]